MTMEGDSLSLVKSEGRIEKARVAKEPYKENKDSQII